MRELGLIGYGAFGRFLARHLARFFAITAYDPAGVTEEDPAVPVRSGTLAEAASRPAVVLAVPVQGMEAVLAEAAPHVRLDALIADVASVKMKPVDLMQRLLPESVQILATHPLFGPQSAAAGIRGHRLVVCPVRVRDPRALVAFFTDHLGLKVIETTPEEHDREMARVQAVPHLLTRVLRDLGDLSSEMATPAYDHLRQVVDLLRNDSDALFRTIQCENPFAAAERRRLRQKLEQIEDELSGPPQQQV